MLSDDQLAELKASLFAGHYNLLLGSGVSLDSFDRDRDPVMGATDLTNTLCTLKGAKSGTTLSRVSLLLTPDEIKKHLTDRYSGCRPGDTVKKLTSFIWKTAFTFNIDDALEAAYEHGRGAKQSIETLNFDSVYETPSNRANLPIVHLHGFAREPEKGYVFSIAEYGRVTRGLNPWMHVLSELLASEPFIISGTSLNESDLEYYLSGRSETSPRKNRGPSILVEPFPDAVTESDCKRHGLVLVKATLSQFLTWLLQKLGNPPSVSQLVVPPAENIFKRVPSSIQQVAFFSAFHLVRPVGPNPEGMLSPFLYGQAAKWADLESSLDIPTTEEKILGVKAREFLESDTTEKQVLCLLADAGTGKSTDLRRLSYDLAKEGKVVLYLTSRVALDTEVTVSCLAALDRPVAIVVDSVANHASSIYTVLTDSRLGGKSILLVCADRQYRKDHIDRLLGDLSIEYFEIEDWSGPAFLQLIEHYRRYGLVGSSDALKYPRKFGDKLLGDPVAIAACRILNNFRPLESIVRSLWNDANEAERRSYAICALAEHCYSGGLYYPVLEAAQRNPSLNDQLRLDCPLPLAYSYEDDDYILPLHPVIATRMLQLLSRDKQDTLFDIFVKLADALAPFVNREAVINQTPEARLAGRLFHAEQVVRQFLGSRAEEFYQKTQDMWQWNSRYWEQRALLIQGTSIDTAVQYAKHAVAIESHPFPWTTLASVLVRKLELTPGHRDALFSEIVEILSDVYRFEERRAWRPTPHPYAVLFYSVRVFLDLGGVLAPKRKEWVLQQVEKCQRVFSRDKVLMTAVSTTLGRLSTSGA